MTSRDGYVKSRNYWQTIRYPLIELEMRRSDCLAWFADRYPGRALPRSACSGCPFRSDREWLILKTTDVVDFADAVEVDRSMRALAEERGFAGGTPYLHERRKPLEEAVDDYERELEMNPRLPGLESGADNECAGVCFV